MYPVPTEAATQGRTDKYIGSWLAQNKSRRGNVILATKVSGASERITWVRDSGKARGGRGAQAGGPARAGWPRRMSRSR
jgi:aryl-alcohol dehydrogenase-like predicted oxidoreductase